MAMCVSLSYKKMACCPDWQHAIFHLCHQACRVINDEYRKDFGERHAPSL